MIDISREKCVGCRISELACSFHHKKVFDHEISSIRIWIGDKGELDIGLSETCDCLVREDMLCIDFCPVDALQQLCSQNPY